MNCLSRSRFLLVALVALALALSGAQRANAEAKLLLDAATGKVLLAENATYPWYPASTTKLMTTYTVLREVQEHKITLNTMITMTRDAAEQEPSKMGLPVGTKLTIDNALKMMLVKSANDIAVAIAERYDLAAPPEPSEDTSWYFHLAPRDQPGTGGKR